MVTNKEEREKGISTFKYSGTKKVININNVINGHRAKQKNLIKGLDRQNKEN